jgi:hypothetical protein
MPAKRYKVTLSDAERQDLLALFSTGRLEYSLLPPLLGDNFVDHTLLACGGFSERTRVFPSSKIPMRQRR